MGYEVFMTVNINITISWDLMLGILPKRNKRFKEIHSLKPEGSRISVLDAVGSSRRRHIVNYRLWWKFVLPIFYNSRQIKGPYYYQRKATFIIGITSLRNTHNNSSIWVTTLSLLHWKIRDSSISSGLHLGHICRHMHDDVHIYCWKIPNGTFECQEGPELLNKLPFF
jgi:hypothetical protein